MAKTVLKEKFIALNTYIRKEGQRKVEEIFLVI